jgi:hypothetical protein
MSTKELVSMKGILNYLLLFRVVIKLLSRIEDCGAELGLRRGGTCELEIRRVFKHRQMKDVQSVCYDRLQRRPWLW